MPLNSHNEAGRVLEVIEDGRTAWQLFSSFRMRQEIGGADAEDLASMIEKDTYLPEPGRLHLLTFVPRLEIVPEPDSSIAKLLAIGDEARLNRYPLLVALLAAEFSVARRLQSIERVQVIFAHHEICLPRVNNPHRMRRVAVSLYSHGNGHRNLSISHTKRGREIQGAVSIAFGIPDEVGRE